MEVNIDKQYPVAASLESAWAVLSNINELATCMPGAQITSQVDDTHYKGSVRVKVGPAVAAFAGDIEVLAVDAGARSLTLLGKGADKGGSSASMKLNASLVAAEDGNCNLVGKADVIVNGKFAQFGGRMMASVSDVILAQFAETFSQKAQALQGSMAAPASVDAAGQQPEPGAVAGTVPAPAIVHAAGSQRAAAPKELNALSLLWAMLRNFFGGLFKPKG
jgi:carbon monoxide dehydrogenase subunit G